ncbi:hypothetical protein ARMGADRAFT_1123569, partial [Armillaria gallica]
LCPTPSHRHPLEYSHDGSVNAVVSQPLPISARGHAAEFCKISPLSLYPPKIIIDGLWDGKLDIWSVGCLIFELITGSPLFKYVPYPKYDLDEPNFMLHQGIGYTSKDFGSQQLLVAHWLADSSIQPVRVHF